MVCGSGALASSPPPPPIRASSQASWAAGASALSWADAPPMGAGKCRAERGRQKRVCRRRAGVGECIPSTHIQDGASVHTCSRLDFLHIKHFLKVRMPTNLSNRNPLVYRMTNNTYLISLLFKFFWRVA